MDVRADALSESILKSKKKENSYTNRIRKGGVTGCVSFPRSAPDKKVLSSEFSLPMRN
jgi:hypothetical protein